MIKKYYYLSLLIMFTVSCGDMENIENQNITEKEETHNEYNEYNKSLDPNAENLVLTGFVSSVFNISVDGLVYEDSEDFYTQELDRLEEEKLSNGYADYELELDAELGLEDMKDGMTVHIASPGERGYAATKPVDYDGQFLVEFPAEAQGEFQIRANKRIGVKLHGPDGDIIQWCYNFYTDLQATVLADSKPIILKNFHTKLTKYKCVSKKRSNSLSIPEKKTVSSNIQVNDQDTCEIDPDNFDPEAYAECYASHVPNGSADYDAILLMAYDMEKEFNKKNEILINND